MKTAYINGIILDGTENMQPEVGKVIIVEDGIIKEIASQENTDIKDCEVVDLNGKYILPGLINLHAHLAGSGKPSKKQIDLEFLCNLLTGSFAGRVVACGMIGGHAKTALMSGVTTVRTVGSLTNYDSQVRDDINAGKRVGPRILTANCAISVPGGHMAGTFAYIAHSPGEAAELVDMIAKDKPDLIKLMITGGVMDSDSLGEPGVLRMPPEYIKAACDRAHELGYRVAAHCEGHEGVLEALRNGVDTIEHGAKPDDEIIALFRERDAAQVMTLSPALPYTKRLPGMMNYSETASKNSEIVVEGMIELAKRCLAEGISVGLGTDSGCSYVTNYDFWRELRYFVQYCAVSNSKAIHTATLVNARIAGIDNITGSIEQGKSADMIAVKKNPLEDISALRDVSMVVFRGRRFDLPKIKKYAEVERLLDEYM